MSNGKDQSKLSFVDRKKRQLKKLNELRNDPNRMDDPNKLNRELSQTRSNIFRLIDRNKKNVSGKGAPQKRPGTPPSKMPEVLKQDKYNKAKLKKLKSLRNVSGAGGPTARPEGLKYGGRVKPYGMKRGGSPACRGMGKATRGGKYTAT